MAKKTEKDKYIEAVGRRKEAVARVRLTPASKTTYTINDMNLDDYFDVERDIETVQTPFKVLGNKDKYFVSVKVSGGGRSSQAEAIRLGISRVLVDIDSEVRSQLKHEGLLRRDPRVKERKKFGKKKARKSPQWSKR